MDEIKTYKSEGERGEYMIAPDEWQITDTETEPCFTVSFRKTIADGTPDEYDWEPQMSFGTFAEAEKYVNDEIKRAGSEIRQLLERLMESLPHWGWTYDIDDANPGVAYVANAAHDFKVTITNND